MKLQSLYEFLMLESQVKFNDEHINHHHGQDDYRVTMYVDGQRVAYCDYVVFRDEVTISYIESLDKGKGYGQAIMKHLAEKYGYENLERTSLTPDGAKMRQKLDKHFNFDYEKHQDSKNQHIDQSLIDNIKNDFIKGFLKDCVTSGDEKAWKKWLANPQFRKVSDYIEQNYNVDFNEIAWVSEWVKGSVENNHNPEEEPNENAMEILKQISNIP